MLESWNTGSTQTTADSLGRNHSPPTPKYPLARFSEASHRALPTRYIASGRIIFSNPDGKNHPILVSLFLSVQSDGTLQSSLRLNLVPSGQYRRNVSESNAPAGPSNSLFIRCSIISTRSSVLLHLTTMTVNQNMGPSYESVHLHALRAPSPHQYLGYSNALKRSRSDKPDDPAHSDPQAQRIRSYP